VQDSDEKCKAAVRSWLPCAFPPTRRCSEPPAASAGLGYHASYDASVQVHVVGGPNAGFCLYKQKITVPLFTEGIRKFFFFFFCLLGFCFVFVLVFFNMHI